MAQKKKLQVFISSTYSDLHEERQAAVEAVLAAGHIPAGMELFAAGDESQMNVIKRWIDESDVYMLILGGRYGSIEPNSQKSYTHLEYEYAVDEHKPLFAVVIDEKCLEKKVKKYGTAVMETQCPDKLKKFREVVCKNMVRFWNDSKDIKISIMETIMEFSNREDLIGWIPGNEAVDVDVVEQLAKLSKENDQLRNENARLGRENEKLSNKLASQKVQEPKYNGLTFDALYRVLKSRDLLDDLQNLSEDVPLWDNLVAPLEINPELVRYGLVRENPKAKGYYLLTDDSKRFLLRLASDL